ncbi:dihydroflavonol-4-reductase [Scheffersomyces coipomensis]|uniref:dihydroflavonol-4-reductase n=1 Tax=Scheffersomyces coipomensis TaxID=1788519 RepID=UPI00315CEF91
MSSQTVFITGATGYIAQHIIIQLLNKGYHVIGQVRSSSKGDALAKDVNNKNFSYEVVEVFEKEGSFDAVLAKHPEVSIFLHTASPATFSVEDNERDILIPAVDGTKNVLKSIKKVAPQIKRVVVTSSIVAAATFAELEDPTYVGGEDSWLSTTYEEAKTADSAVAYTVSKKYAELAAWDFVKQETPKFKLTTVLPGYVFGPQAFESGLKNLNLTAAFVANALQLKREDTIPAVISLSADVRDIAKAHILAFEKEDAVDKRIAVYSTRFQYSEFVDIIRRNFKEYDAKLPVTETLPADHFDNFVKFDDSKSRKILDFEYIKLEKTIVDLIAQVLAYQNKA